MRFGLMLLLAAILTPAASLPSAAQAPEGPVYVVSYIEVAPANRGTAVGLLRQLALAARKDDGNMRYEILQRTVPGNQFAIVSIWKDQKAYDAHQAAAHAKDFRDRIKPFLISAIDDRTHTGLEVAAADGAKVGRGAIFVVTHVDVPPPRKDECIALLKALVADSRKEGNGVRFEVFQQGSRPNHFSVVEIWKNQRGYDGHITAAHTRKFRDQLTPMSGALYDERLYRAL
jgi:quinol monooxygenase YgiN